MSNIFQLSIYDFLEKEGDPLFQKINSLRYGEKIMVHGLEIYLNESNFYEVLSPTIHEGFKTPSRCYSWICQIL